MKKRLLSLLLTACMAVSLLVLPASAAETVTFSDVQDRDTAVAVETLRLMGVLDGYQDGSFRPETPLNRAQFCKMVTYATNRQDRLGLYRTVTVFPDVKPSHWAAAYINLASRTPVGGGKEGEPGQTVIAGFLDGKFHPERVINMGQAVTILLRLLGYQDQEIGGIWPDSYMAAGAAAGLLKGLPANAAAPVTRGQAARLFLNLLCADIKGGGSYLATLGTVAEDQVLASSAAGNDGRSLQMTGGEKTYQLASGKRGSGILNGRKGTLLLNENGKALTFVPDALGVSYVLTLSSCTTSEIIDITGAKYVLDSGTKAYHNGKETTWSEVSSWLHAGASVTLYQDASGEISYVFVGGGSSSNAAVVVAQDGSSVGFDSLTNGVQTYQIVKNGVSAGLGDLRRYDVATYSSATNTIRVNDTRVTVYYEDCAPNPQAPETIKVLGKDFSVLPTAVESLSHFKPGDRMTLLLTEDGRVAGAVEADQGVRGNAMGVVRNGEVLMFCGTNRIALKAQNAAEYEGQLVRISSGSRDAVTLNRVSGGVSGDLKVTEKKLGAHALAENVVIFQNGKEISLSQLTEAVIDRDQILYARTDWADRVDLIALGQMDQVIYGRAIVKVTKPKPGETNGKEQRTVAVSYGNDQQIGPLTTGFDPANGAFVAATVDQGPDGVRIVGMRTLDAVKKVPNSAWSGQSSVMVGGRSYRVPADVKCYNKATGMWITLSQAHAYAGSSDLYVEDHVVRIVEVG